ncbi:MAG TPA: hypothetical protein VFT29_04535 [Gemmatimonadaceae bacterium]|nr:hypothetical protein [Gemmatimonadaceae bacterium]
MNERDITRERFVSAIADKVNPEDVAEVHLFHPMKAGGLESGVAVLAVRERKDAAVAEAGFVSDPDATGTEGATEHVANDLAVPTGAEGDAESQRRASAPQHLRAQLNAAADSDVAEAAENASIAADERLAVYTAKYRLTLKGPERGKWTFDIHAEADAPLITVDRVVQGVQRRSGDAEEPRKLSGDEFRALLPPKEVVQGQAV